MKKGNAGFTFVEIILVIVVVGILAGSLAPLLASAADSWTFVMERRDVIAEARTSMFKVAREVRQIGGSGDITVATSGVLEFNDAHGTHIRFEQSGGNLLRNGYVLASNLDSTAGLSFAYRDGNNNTTSNIIDIRSVIVTVTLQNSTGSFSLQNRVWLRNAG
ncbi:MAG: prepilin-type N-terminal cleavage/methylation domain-containing protein [Candidatus Omnitrophica bacterium]|nr:prepilin-type N-terminal cleavage/methylation domain-containing protein [Candidatus Omnitrophota bacterium]